MSDITREFIKLMFCEAKLTKNPWDLPSANEMIGIVYQITEVAKSSLVLRSYNTDSTPLRGAIRNKNYSVSSSSVS